MSTAETQRAGIDPQILADLDAVMKRMIDGTPVDAETSRRIEHRAEQITEETRPARCSDCNTDAMAGFAGAHGLEHRWVSCFVI